MKYYIDITLLLSDDIGHYFLWEKVYQQLHIALVDFQKTNGNSEIGIGFPEFNAKNNRLGRKARLFAITHSAIEQFNAHQWLDRLQDYVHITTVRDVPVSIKGYESFSRLQVKCGNPERYARRAAKRQGISYEQALENRKSMLPTKVKNPFVWMKSLSSDNRFRLIIQHTLLNTKVLEYEEIGFDSYGLAKNGALPSF